MANEQGLDGQGDSALYRAATRGRHLLYGLRKHSRLRPSEITKRHGRSPIAVTLAIRDQDREARNNVALRRKLSRLANAVDELATRLAR